MRHRRRAIHLAAGPLAGLALLVALAGASRAADGDPAATVAELAVQPAALSPNGDGSGDAVTVTFANAVEQDVLVYVGDRLGQVVQTLHGGVLPAGPVAVTWDGRRADGTVVADGAYDVIVEAHHPDGGRSVLRGPVVADTVAPLADLARTRLELAGADATSFALPLELSEAAHLDVAVTGAAGPTMTPFDQPAGAHALEVPVASRPVLDRALRRGAAPLWVRVTATDLAGNRASRLASVRLGSGTLDWPLLKPALSSRFGVRWGRMHEGVDLAAKQGSRILAADGGVVVRAGWWGGYGNVVIIDHGTRTTLYGHQSRLAVRKGQVVARGQVIGRVGSTGSSTGPHLHFELRIDGELQDPLDYLPRRRLPVVP
jgi:hypothetical protein